jgi:hypothetical protein
MYAHLKLKYKSLCVLTTTQDIHKSNYMGRIGIEDHRSDLPSSLSAVTGDLIPNVTFLQQAVKYSRYPTKVID